MKRLRFTMLTMGCILTFLTATSYSADVTITFTDSTKVEETYGYTASPITNFSRVISGDANRVYTTLGQNYSNYYHVWFRIPDFKDSCDNHAGLILDSGKIVFKVFEGTTITGAEYLYLRAIGVDTNMNWVEGNSSGADAQDCQVCWDSAQAVGPGTCASKQEWATAGGTGTTDTLGQYFTNPSDSLYVIEGTNTSWGDACTFWVDTAVMNIWKSAAHANEGCLVMPTTTSGNIQAFLKLYSSESNMTGSVDSIPVFTLYGHTDDAGIVKKLGKVKLGESKW